MRKPCRNELKGHLRSTHLNRGLRGRRRSCARLEAFARTFEDEPLFRNSFDNKSWKTYTWDKSKYYWPLENRFQGQKPRRFENFQNCEKWRNQADKRHCLNFIFHPGTRKRPKKPEVWKNRLWAQSGSGYWETESAYQNPRKGTETPWCVTFILSYMVVGVPKSP